MTDTETQAFDVLMAQAEAYKRGALAIWTVYDHPKDYPDGFIARMHEVAEGPPRPTDKTLMGELEEIRRVLIEAGLTTLPRDARDEREVVESWI